MARVLLAWELGANLGHVAPMRALALALRARGHDCVFAACDLRAAEEFIEPELGPVLQAPLRFGAGRNPVRTQVSYASLLNNSGFDDVVGLAARVRAWRGLIESSGAQLLVADHAPTALLAARCIGLPRANVGTGFSVPPLLRPFPPFDPSQPLTPDVLPRNESAVLQNVNAALARLTLPSLQSLQDVLGGASGHVLSYRELDHYECERQEPYLGVPDLSYGAPPQWPAGDGPRIIAYLRPIRQLAQILTALSRCRARVLLRIGDVAATGLESYLRPGLVIVDRPVNMLQAARDCDAFVSYASHGFVAEMLLAGKPGLLLPELLERNLVARRAGQLGATLAPPAQGAFNLSQALERVIEDGSLRAAAERFAARYRGQDRSAIPGDLADQLLQSLSRASPARPVVP